MEQRQAERIGLPLDELQANAGAHRAALQDPVIPATASQLLEVFGEAVDAIAAINFGARATRLGDLNARRAKRVDVA